MSYYRHTLVRILLSILFVMLLLLLPSNKLTNQSLAVNIERTDHLTVIMSSSLIKNLTTLMGLRSIDVDSSALETVSLKQINTLWIADADTLISEKALSRIKNEVNAGMNLVLIHSPKIASYFGVQSAQSEITVNTVIHTIHNNRPIQWPKSQPVYPIMSTSKILPFVVTAQKDVIAASMQYGKGQIAYVATPIAESAELLYEKYPYLHESLSSILKLTNPLGRQSLTYFVDWGFHYQTPPEQLIVLAKKFSAKTLYWSGWYDSKAYWDYTSQLLSSAHANGIKVILWLELPMVSKPFWDAHPEWRERTATNLEAHLDWRYLMAIEIPECQKAIEQYYLKKHLTYPFDGVNLAELYFETPGLGHTDLRTYTPYHPWVQQEFKLKHPSLSPWSLTDSATLDVFQNYRQLKVQALNQHWMTFFKSNKTKVGSDLILTQIDTVQDSAIQQHIGISSDEMYALANTQKATFLLEDPFTLWHLNPNRYQTIATSYDVKNKKVPFGIDINIVNRSGIVQPYTKQIGLECLMLVQNAIASFDFVSLYALNTLDSNDAASMGGALTTSVDYTVNSPTQVQYTAPYSFLWKTIPKGMVPFIDGLPHIAYSESGIFLPTGKHELTFKLSPQPPIQITDLNCDVEKITLIKTQVTLQYTASESTYLVSKQKLKNLKIDGKNLQLQTSPSGKGVSILLPAGKHTFDAVLY